jgi:hypothetical protein
METESLHKIFPTIPLLRQMNAIKASKTYFSKIILILSFHLCLSVSSCLFSPGFSNTLVMIYGHLLFQCCFPQFAIATLYKSSERDGSLQPDSAFVRTEIMTENGPSLYFLLSFEPQISRLLTLQRPFCLVK